MNITLFTSNQLRHLYLINLLSKISKKLYVIQEEKSLINIKKNIIFNEYFNEVGRAQNKFFGKVNSINFKNTIIKKMPKGELNKAPLETFNEYLKSDYYIVYGSSFIKNELADFLIDKKAINIHMGVSPYYKGSGCNFWAIFDNNPNLVGSTIHLLSKKLDSGPIIYHALSNIKTNPFDYTMSSVKAAFISLIMKLKDNKLFDSSILEQDNTKLIRYSRGSDFNEKIVSKFYNLKIDLNSKNTNYNQFHNPFIYKG